MLDLALDTHLTTLHRELSFVARTLHSHYVGRPRHTRTKTAPQLALSTYQPQSDVDTPNMLSRLLFSPVKARFGHVGDIESAPAIAPAANTGPRRWNTVANRPTLEQHKRYHSYDAPIPQLNLPLDLAPPVRRRPVALPRPVSCGEEVLLKPPGSPFRRATSVPNANGRPARDSVTFIIDARSQALVYIPRKYVPAALLNAQKPERLSIQPNPSSDEQEQHQGIYLPSVTLADFTDFSHWTRTSRILPYPFATAESGVQDWLLEHSARRLICALSLAITTLGSEEYAQAGVAELSNLVPLLEWPEDYVNAIFAATRPESSPANTPQPATAKPVGNSFDPQQWDTTHPARQLIVSVIATKTHGPRKQRNVRLGPRRKNLESEEEVDTRIRSGTFWSMYDWYCTDMDVKDAEMKAKAKRDSVREGVS
ncbi:hypothetical protein LTR56_017626 [Elasticomyces elasticus]|nr:hypothetical protein LTR56_017626 [Elasticomyces elasticus]KAK3638598.1 hypothetical protein LTR22_017782 [Elasticomyces elasticus]KAK4913022.1 hypothetical protein LTR49_018580 [Elasticomyces elasticus]KAK5757582.1 hypothetical protein LTS12_012288 [Elasticomyces elasticus]